MVSSIILAAGSGKRMGKGINKVFLDLAGHPILFYSIRAFQEHPLVDEIILVLKEDEIEKYRETILDFGFGKVKAMIAGGPERMDSVRAGLTEVADDSNLVLIHDGARPLVSERIIRDAVAYGLEYGAACPAVALKDTIKVVSEDSLIKESLRRESLRAVQTPQAFQTDIFRELMDKAHKTGRLYTDDTAIYTDAGRVVYLFEGSYDNLKLTTEEDLAQARQILKERTIFNNSGE